MDVVCSLLGLVVLVIIIWIVLGYVVNFGRVPSGHPVRRLYDLIASGVDPVLRPIRSALPPLRMGGGGVALDLSPIVLILGISIIRGIIC
jgi:YggT family protein